MSGLAVIDNSLSRYLSQINHYPLLERDEEYELARRFRDGNDLAAAHQLVCANLRFVVKIAREYQNYGFRLLDLIQEGNIGLMMAVKKFDPAFNNRLISYAVWWIRAYIHNFIINSWSMVKIGTTQAQKKLFFKLKQTREKLKNLYGSADIDVMAKELDVAPEAVQEMSQRLNRDTSLDIELVEGENVSRLDLLACSDTDQEQRLIDHQSTHHLQSRIHHALKSLTAREQDIVRQRILSDPARTLQELADHYQVSRERIRQIEKNALGKLKAVLSAEEE
ncbi:MAG: RNA polymerase sigma factor RpoH [Desulfuromonadaceae bacterium]|nr:RNA polymerase sigma factor RpoH [Desulfuromonadaceae bacterium]